jgi:eukaryotic-like serine/threonine-protein kinase
MPLTPGTLVGPYEILGQIGVGGMGEVYRARDTGLHRDVAIKVLPDEFAQDAERLARFEREARTLASLNHPGIATIHGLERTGTARALVMEFVDGPTLADRIAEGPLPVDEALAIVRQIADALEAAHDQGIVHRDLKPANIKLRPDGTVKVLDFGLAKTIEPSGAVTGRSMSPTITTPAMTQAGTILGTAAYMSPEQAKGRGVDKRSDVWALGCVLYELLTGRQAFDGEDVSETLASILRSEPDWNALPENVPPGVVALLRRMLEKDRRQRVADVAAVTFVLSEPPLMHARGAVASRMSPVWVGIAALCALAIGGLSYVAGGRLRVDANRPVTRLTIPLTDDQTLSFAGSAIAISPDGRYVAYVANGRVYLRALNSLETVVVQGSESNVSVSGGTRRPKFSPDSKWLAFAKDNEIRRVAVAGGPLVTLVQAPGLVNFVWDDDGSLIYQAEQNLWRAGETGGNAEPIARGLTGRVQSFDVLPGGDLLLSRFPAGTIAAARSEIVVRSIADGRETVVVTGGIEARYVPTGHLLYYSNGNLLTVPFDLPTLKVTGAPQPVADNVSSAATPEYPVAAAHVALSPAGTLAYVRSRDRRPNVRSLLWVDRAGREEPLGQRDEPYAYPRLSPDNRFVGVTMQADSRDDIWLLDIARRTARPLTTETSNERYTVWTPDGKRVAFASSRADDAATWLLSVDGSGAPTRIAGFPVSRYLNFFPTSISPQGDRLVVTSTSPVRTSPSTSADIWMVPLQGGEPKPLLQTSATERNGEISPNGKWLAYETIENGQTNIIVRPFPDVESGHWRVSNGGGSQPLWSRDGKELFYLDAANFLNRVPIEAGSSFTTGPQTKLLSRMYVAAIPTYAGRQYDISRDGKRFLVMKEVAPTTKEEPTTIVIVQNWFEELRARR